jgi:TolB-like protein
MQAWIMLVGIISVSGCQLLSSPYNQCGDCAAARTATQIDEQALQQWAGDNDLPVKASLYGRPSKPLSDYAADLALQLLSSMQYQTPKHTIAIASFVHFDQSLNKTNALGNQLSEHMYFQLQRLGISVADVKVSRQIRLGARGDSVMRRGPYLHFEQQAHCVLTGTMLRDSAGVVVNARVIHLQSKTVLASGQIHIPNFVLAALTKVELNITRV